MGAASGQAGAPPMERGISRRDVLRRGAIVGGALVWTAPTVQTLGMRAAFAADDDTTGSPRGTGQDISYLAAVIQCPQDQYWKFKIDDDGTVEHGGNLPCCPYPPNWDIARRSFPPGMSSSDIDISDPKCWLVQLPAGCTLVGVAMGGGGDGDEECSPPHTGFCQTTYTMKAGNTYQFCSPPTV
ncbi:MAG: hypothetical protein R3320_09895 [Nitriliruptorales bacterium]|nr:hypothetical protein [Nitriliruptorales bacterium]